jgi:hypothetical protein
MFAEYYLSCHIPTLNCPSMAVWPHVKCVFPGMLQTDVVSFLYLCHVNHLLSITKLQLIMPREYCFLHDTVILLAILLIGARWHGCASSVLSVVNQPVANRHHISVGLCHMW